MQCIKCRRNQVHCNFPENETITYVNQKGNQKTIHLENLKEIVAVCLSGMGEMTYHYEHNPVELI